MSQVNDCIVARMSVVLIMKLLRLVKSFLYDDVRDTSAQTGSTTAYSLLALRGVVTVWIDAVQWRRLAKTTEVSYIFFNDCLITEYWKWNHDTTSVWFIRANFDEMTIVLGNFSLYNKVWFSLFDAVLAEGSVVLLLVVGLRTV